MGGCCVVTWDQTEVIYSVVLEHPGQLGPAAEQLLGRAGGGALHAPARAAAVPLHPPHSPLHPPRAPASCTFLCIFCTLHALCTLCTFCTLHPSLAGITSWRSRRRGATSCTSTCTSSTAADCRCACSVARSATLSATRSERSVYYYEYIMTRHGRCIRRTNTAHYR